MHQLREIRRSDFRRQNRCGVARCAPRGRPTRRVASAAALEILGSDARIAARRRPNLPHRSHRARPRRRRRRGCVCARIRASEGGRAAVRRAVAATQAGGDARGRRATASDDMRQRMGHAACMRSERVTRCRRMAVGGPSQQFTRATHRHMRSLGGSSAARGVKLRTWVRASRVLSARPTAPGA